MGPEVIAAIVTGVFSLLGILFQLRSSANVHRIQANLERQRLEIERGASKGDLLLRNDLPTRRDDIYHDLNIAQATQARTTAAIMVGIGIVSIIVSGAFVSTATTGATAIAFALLGLAASILAGFMGRIYVSLAVEHVARANALISADRFEVPTKTIQASP